MKRLKTQRMLYSIKPTSYRKQKVLELEKIVLEEAERDKTDYQNILFSNRITNFLFKHFESMNKTANIPDEFLLEKTANNMQDKAEPFSYPFQSVFSHSQFDCTTGNPDGAPTLNNFATSKKLIRSILEETGITKSRGPDAIPPTFFQKLSEPMSNALHIIFKAIKRNRAIPDEWKVGAGSPKKR